MIIAVIYHVPLWVYPLLLGLILLGWTQTRPRIIPVWRGLILPVVMTVLSLVALFTTLGSSLPGWPAWVIGLATPLLVSQRLAGPGSTLTETDSGQLRIPGSWWPLILIALVFVARFVVNLAVGVNPALTTSFGFVLLTGLVYGALSGAFVVRAMPIMAVFRRRLQWRHMKTGQS